MAQLKFRKLKAEEIDIRVGRVINNGTFKGATLLLYKDARVDMSILDETVGPMNWQRKHTRENANCSVGIFNEDRNEWIWKEDTGTESYTEAEKGLASDSFKRACVNWGIGRELYSAKNILVECELNKDGNKPASGLSWYVKEIEYTEEEISKLVIVERYKKSEREVFWLGAKKSTPAKNEEVEPEVEPLCTPKQITEMQELGVNMVNALKTFKKTVVEELTYREAEYIITTKKNSLKGD